MRCVTATRWDTFSRWQNEPRGPEPDGRSRKERTLLFWIADQFVLKTGPGWGILKTGRKVCPLEENRSDDPGDEIMKKRYIAPKIVGSSSVHPC